MWRLKGTEQAIENDLIFCATAGIQIGKMKTEGNPWQRWWPQTITAWSKCCCTTSVMRNSISRITVMSIICELPLRHRVPNIFSGQREIFHVVFELTKSRTGVARTNCCRLYSYSCLLAMPYWIGRKASVNLFAELKQNSGGTWAKTSLQFTKW